MSLSELEAVVLTEENLIDHLVDEFDEDVKPQERKCGEIITNGNDMFTFWCVFCKKVAFMEIAEFAEHFRQYHTKSSTFKLEFDPLEPNKFNEYENIKVEPVENETEITNLDCTSEQTTDENDQYIIISSNLLSGKTQSTNINLNEDSKNILDEASANVQKFPSEHAKTFKCDICNKKYALKSSLNRHKKIHSTYKTDSEINQVRTLNCDACDRKFRSEKALNKHKMYDHQPLDPFMKGIEGHEETDISSDDSNNSENLGAPRKNQNASSSLFIQEIEDPLKCRYCDRRFATRLRRIEHERIHTGERPFKCEICGKCFRFVRYLKKHDMIHKGIKPHKCTLCDAAFTDKSNLKQHIRRHLGDKKIQCTFCDKRFQQNSERKIHERTHTGEKPFQCSVCGKCFTTSEKVGRHIARHQNIRSFKCDECSRCFNSNRDLKEHKIAHTSEKPYVCKICNAAFPRRKALKSHEKIHSDVTEYICTICGKGFKQNPGLYCHMKSHGLSSKS